MRRKRGAAALLAAALLLTGCAPAPAVLPAVPAAVQKAPMAAPGKAERGDGAGREGEPAGEAPEPPDVVEALLDAMTLEELAGQMFLARCPKEHGAELAEEYHLGGYVLFGRDFRGKSREEVTATLAAYQAGAAIPLLLAVDEEGGTVNRVSANPQLAAAPFPSPRQLWEAGGAEAVRRDAREKAALLKGLGIQVNLAPVCDVAQSPESYIYPRALGLDALDTAEYVAAVVEESQGAGVGSVLKHFPGYGGNGDTHTGTAVDERPLEDFRARDFLPFQAGIQAGCGGVLVSHNIMAAVDGDYPASLSPRVHSLLREELGVQGVILTDDLEMAAVSDAFGVEEAAVLAVLAGNDMLCTTDFIPQLRAVVEAAEAGRIPLQRLRESAERVLRWKQALGLLEPSA